MNIEKPSLLAALGAMMGAPVRDAVFSEEILHGGTVGDVRKLSGEAVAGDCRRPFALVVKTQRRWERHGDPGCWRREYEIYKNGLPGALAGDIQLPRCYLLEEENDLTRIWMEYIEGRTGKQLCLPDLELAAEKLGRQQAQFHLNGKIDLPYLRGFPAARSSFDLWWNRVKKPLCRPMLGFSKKLRTVLNEYAARAGTLLEAFDSLPTTLCQGDVHNDNLIIRGSEVYLIDWDSAGYGRMGEDAVDMLAEVFVYSDADISLLPEFRRRIAEGYCRGARGGGMELRLDDRLVRDIFALAWGFRVADRFLQHKHYKCYFSKKASVRKRCVQLLRAMLLEEYP